MCKVKPITRQQILDSSKLIVFADDNFKFDKNGKKLSKGVENIVGKREIARYQQFLLFPVFSKGFFPGASKGVIVWKWVYPLLHRYSFKYINNRLLFENIVGKGEIARNEQFLLCPQCLPVKQLIESPFVHIFAIISLFAA